MTLISFQQFRGIRPALDPELLPNEEAQTAQNARLRKGLLRPWDQVLLTSALVTRQMLRTIYLYQSSHWLEWDADVDLVVAPLSGDTAYKVYYTGDGIPKKTNFTLATTGSGAKPISFYALALPSPKHAAVAGAPGAGGSGDARNVTYTWTLVNDWGEESIPAPASNIVAPLQGQSVALTGMSHVWQAGTSYTVGEFVIPTVANGYLYKCIVAGTTGGAEPTWGTTVDGNTTDNTATWRCFPDNMSYKRIYRINTGTEFAAYYYLDQIAASATTYTDTKTDTQLGEELLTTTYDPPPDGLQGLIYIGNGMAAAFSGKDVYFCEPWKFSAWPTGYSISLPATVIALAAIGGNTFIALTDSVPYIFTGTDPASMTHDPLSDAMPCVSKRGVVTTTLSQEMGARNIVLYPTPAGIYKIDGASGELITRNHLDLKSFASYYPATMHSVVYDHFYFGFYSSGGNQGCLIFDLKTGDLLSGTLYADAAHVDPLTGKLYYAKRTNEVILQEGGTSYPSRTNAILQEDGTSYILRE